MNAPVIEITDIVTRLSGALIHDGVSFSVQRGEVMALIGGSGTGKSVLLKEIIGLIKPQSGSIKLFGSRTAHCSPR
jgi:phospholipid/cholesterol/gamma-HCH transport system ATP-binding protein